MNGRNRRSVFHQSVTGVSHIRKGTPCQDASGASFSSDEYYWTAVVADGHGDPSCMRSEKGSSIAVSTVIECLEEFGKYYPEYADIQSSYPGRFGAGQAIKQLTDSIACVWTEKVLGDLQYNPLLDEEKERAGDTMQVYENGEHLERIYGTTLLAVLETKDYTLVLQQGDGRCDLLYSNGDMIQPIPEDERCYANVTTSLSDDDVSKKIRGHLIVGKNEELLACFVGTDGLDNAFFDDDELNEFYLETCMKLLNCKDDEEVSFYLERLLKDVSKNGNGDDVSLAGVISSEMAKDWVRKTLDNVDRIRTEKVKGWYVDNMSAMEESLRELRTKIDKADPEERDDYLEEYLALENRYQTMKNQSELLEHTEDDDWR